MNMTKRKDIIYHKHSSVLMRVDPEFKEFMAGYSIFLQGKFGVDINSRKASYHLHRAIKVGKNPFDMDLDYF